MTDPAARLSPARRAADVRRLLLGAVALGAVVLLAMIGTTLYAVASYQQTTRWVNHTHQVRDVVAEIRLALSRAESARRAYVVTGGDDYLQRFDVEEARLPALQARFRQLTADSAAQQANAAELGRLIALKMQEQQASFALLRSGRASDADAERMIRENQTVLDQLRDRLIGMTAQEDRLLRARTDQQTDLSRLLDGVVLASGAVLAFLAISSFLLMRRYAGDLDRAQGALRQMNLGLEAEVERRTADLRRVNEEVQRFAYIVSHDLRSPLVNIMGFTAELETAAKPLAALVERVKLKAPALLTRPAQEAVEIDLPESIGFIRASTQKMDRLIAAILRLSREGRRNLTPEPIDMDALVDGVFGSLKSLADDRGAVLQREGELPDLVGDRVAVEQVLSNLVENALKYLKPGRPGVIRVRGHIEHDARVFEVEDNGRGIAPKDHERVFELFRRAGQQDQPGEGIGLAHVRALLQRLGGSIALESELDRGATFRVYLPPNLNRVQEPA